MYLKEVSGPYPWCNCTSYLKDLLLR